eukprot:394886_1
MSKLPFLLLAGALAATNYVTVRSGCYGKWKGWHSGCGTEGYGRWMQVRWEEDTGINVIELKCDDGNFHRMSNFGGWWGSWKGFKDCGYGHFICGGQIREDCSGDDSGANGLRMRCCEYARSSKTNSYRRTKSVYDGDEGGWKSVVDCPHGQKVDTGKIKVEDKCCCCDNTAVNGLQLKCVDADNTAPTINGMPGSVTLEATSRYGAKH